VRSFTAAVAVSVAAGAVVRFAHVARSSELAWASERLAYLIPAAVALGGALYALASWSDDAVWVTLRRIGWAGMALPLVVPSTFTLALPLLGPLFVTLGDFAASRTVPTERSSLS
jgi:hypothetical protein